MQYIKKWVLVSDKYAMSKAFVREDLHREQCAVNLESRVGDLSQH